MRRLFVAGLALAVVLPSGVVGKAVATRSDARQHDENARDSSRKPGAMTIPPGTAVELRLENGEKVRGRVAEVTEDHVVVQWVKKDTIENRKISVAEVKSIKVLRAKPSTAKSVAQYIFVGVLGGAVGVGELAKEKRK